MKLTPWLVILSLCLVACSGSKSAQKVNEEPPQIELSDADEFIENPSDAPAETTTEAAPEATADVSETPAEPVLTDATETAPAETVTEPVVADEEAPVVVEEDLTPVAESRPAVEPGTMLEYKVGKNETLMMIA